MNIPTGDEIPSADRRAFDRKSRALLVTGLAVYLIVLVVIESRPELTVEQRDRMWVGKPAQEVVDAAGSPREVIADRASGSVMKYRYLSIEEGRFRLNHLDIYVSEDGVVYRVARD